mmetsp:Transcript_118750/g.369994  ORF Transcript_118750/g.369994 Transcript_118750/m.369994 type:complete len:332 (-) Transcript_118750:74-1069(-)
MPRGERKDPVWTKLPVPGVVTARRDSGQTLKLRQKRQEEVEQAKKQVRQAEEAARVLARRWKQEDRGEAGGSRRREEGEDPEAVDAQRRPRDVEYERETTRTEREADPAGVWVVTEEVKRPPPPPRSQRSDVEVAERRPAADVAAAFESLARPEKRRREHRSPSPAAAVASGGAASSSLGRRSPSPGASERREAAPTAKPKSKAKTALAGVFGLDDSDEERESAAKQMERAAAAGARCSPVGRASRRAGAPTRGTWRPPSPWTRRRSTCGARSGSRAATARRCPCPRSCAGPSWRSPATRSGTRPPPRGTSDERWAGAQLRLKQRSTQTWH